MSIEWTSIIYTILAGIAGWMFLCMAIDGFRGTSRTPSMAAAIVALAMAAGAAVAGVVTIGGPQNIFTVLRGVAHSGPSRDELCFLVLLVCLIVLPLMLRRGASSTALRVVLVIGGISGGLIPFLGGAALSYAAYPARDTVLMPLAYWCTCIPAGIALYLAVIARQGADGKTIHLFGLLLLGGGALCALGSASFAIMADALNAASIAAGLVQAVSIWALPCIMAGILVVICGAAIMRHPERAFHLAIVAFACALAACVMVRCVMYLASVAPHLASHNLSYQR